MKLLVIRHAIAEDRAAFALTGQEDALRPLTGAGQQKMQRIAAGLATLVPGIDLLATSKLARAVQTADILAPIYKGAERVAIDELAPGHRPVEFLRWLGAQSGYDTVAVVGHEPHLRYLLGWLLTGRGVSFISLKKGAVCLLEFAAAPTAATAKLLWALTPGQLRALKG